VGAGNVTYVQADLAAPGRPISVSAQLGAPGVPARIQACHQGQCVELFRGSTDAGGRVTTSVDPARLTGNLSGLAMLAASLDGSRGQLASTSVGIAVGTHVTRVASAAYMARAVAGQSLSAADTLVLGVDDTVAGGDRAVAGTIHVLDAGGRELASQPFDTTSFLQGTRRTVTLPASGLEHAGAYYRVVGFLTTQDNRVYSIHQALRGVSVGASAPKAEPFHSATLQVVVRSFQNNLDAQKDPGLELPVHVKVLGLPGNGAFEADARVEEGGEKRIDVPFSGDAATYPVTVNVTSGELRAVGRVEVLVARAQGGLLGIPGPEPAVALVVVALAALLHRRRTEA
ncbi:MAG: hypothetical protein LC624_05620, partial [Halobacteriales archaeon]|nr:hypothetical protein [Halobacteriales archaeon]